MRNKTCNLGSIRKGYSQEIHNKSEKLKEEAADLAVNNCASYVDGECVIKGGPCNYETGLPIGVARCYYMETSVLPQEKELEQRYKAAISITG